MSQSQLNSRQFTFGLPGSGKIAFIGPDHYEREGLSAIFDLPTRDKIHPSVGTRMIADAFEDTGQFGVYLRLSSHVCLVQQTLTHNISTLAATVCRCPACQELDSVGLLVEMYSNTHNYKLEGLTPDEPVNDIDLGLATQIASMTASVAKFIGHSIPRGRSIDWSNRLVDLTQAFQKHYDLTPETLVRGITMCTPASVLDEAIALILQK